MIVTNNITKSYGTQVALDAVSFEAKPGKILGLLGPNGAGKSTLIKIMTGYLPADSGSVTICGHQMGVNKPEFQHLIGYLPEHNPLYLDMYVRQYLQYVAGLYNVDNAKIDEVIHQVGLESESKKRIKQLSKGYRQRVGLAQALIHDPEVLILDEPTTGLDPNQIVEVRDLIRRVAVNKTVILSTHIMQEVHSICDEVLIINKGKVVANDSVDNILTLSNASQFIEVEFDQGIDVAQFHNAFESISSIKELGGHKYLLHIASEHDIRAQISGYAVSQGWIILMLQQRTSDLEDVFAQLTHD